MPLNPDGTWRPWNATDREEVTHYFEQIIRDGTLSDTDAIFRAGARFNLSYDYDRLAMYNYLRAAHKAVDAAEAANQNPNALPDPGDIPNVSQDPVRAGLFVYEVLIRWTDPTTGQVIPAIEIIVSDQPLTGADVQAHVASNIQDYIANNPSVVRRGQDPTTWNVSVVIISVSRGV